MFKNKKLTLVFLFAIFVNLTYAQNSFVHGYIIKNSGDKITGYVNYRAWEYNPDKINFKSDRKSEVITYTPSTIREFGVKGEIYVSGVIQTETTQKMLDQLDNSPNIDPKSKTAFLEILFLGSKALYYYKNNEGIENFYIKDNGKFQLLEYKRYLIKDDGKVYLTYNERYQRQLALYLNDYKGVGSELKHTRYKIYSMHKLFQSYYKNTSQEPTFERVQFMKYHHFGILLGVTKTFFNVQAKEAYVTNAKYTSSNDNTFGLVYSMFLPYKLGQWSIINELNFTSYTTDGQYGDSLNNLNDYTVAKTSFKYIYMKINTMVRYRYPIGDIYWFTNLGISNGYAILSDSYFEKTHKFYSSVNTTRGEIDNTSNTYDLGYILAGTGIFYKRFSLEVRFERAVNMSHNSTSNLHTLTSRFYFLAGIWL